jgi:hypothetical protein
MEKRNEERLASARLALQRARESQDEHERCDNLLVVFVQACRVDKWSSNTTTAQRGAAERLVEEAKKLWPTDNHEEDYDEQN